MSEILQAVQSAVIKYAYPTDNFSSGDQAQVGKLNEQEDILLLSFAPPDPANQYKNITRAVFSVFTDSSPTTEKIDILDASFAEGSVTWITAPAMETGVNIQTAAFGPPKEMQGNVTNDRLAALIVKNGVAVRRILNGSFTAYTSRSAYKPQVDVYYDDVYVGPSVYGASPQSGYIDPSQPLTVRWQTVPNGHCYADVYQISAVLSWRPVGGAKTDIPLTTETEFTFPANTFSSGGIEWRVAVTSNNGLTSTSAWYQLATDDAIPTTIALQPADIMVDGSQPIKFTWDYQISTGTAQTKAEINASINGGPWSIIATILGDAEEWTAPAGTVAAGPLYWAARGYNSDGVQSEWSAYKAVIVVSAPGAPSVMATQSPQMTVSWQGVGQEAAEVEVDGIRAPIIFGTKKTMVWPAILADGQHVVRVRIQNAYGLWSDWGTCPVATTNIPGTSISLTGSGISDASLGWTDNSSDEYQVLRDGEVIATIPSGSDLSFVDDLAGAGVHTYAIRGIDAGYYTMSNAVALPLVIDGILLKARGEWLDLGMTLTDPQTISEQWSSDVTFVHYSGSSLPVAETSGQEMHVYAFRPSFPPSEYATADKLQRVNGETVWIKDCNGLVIKGVLSAVPQERTAHHRTFDVSVTEVR